MAELKISKMQENILAGAFDCGNESINALMKESYYPTILQHAYTYLASVGQRIVGAYMLKFMKIVLADCPENISEYKGMFEDCFSIHIKYIAVEKDLQGKGIGYEMLKDIVRKVRKLCEQWPVRLITLDALKDKYEWYVLLGFQPFNEDDMKNNESTIKMYLDCLIDVNTVNNYIDECMEM